MTELKWTDTQMRRFKELGIVPEDVPSEAVTPELRNQFFQQIEKKKIKAEKQKLDTFLSNGGRVGLEKLSETLTRELVRQGFVRVTTPLILSKSALARMTIDESHPLFRQIYWISEKKCLRPMLAPNLYSLMIDFSRVRKGVTRFFEIGPCFRKESDGARHNSEFTMLNLVEMGLSMADREDRIQELATLVAESAGLTDYEFETESSEVYGSTLDIVAGPEKIEVASGAMGPHPLDAAWGFTDTWVGIGFGMERLLMTANKSSTIGRWGKSLSFLDGISLKI